MTYIWYSVALAIMIAGFRCCQLYFNDYDGVTASSVLIQGALNIIAGVYIIGTLFGWIG